MYRSSRPLCAPEMSFGEVLLASLLAEPLVLPIDESGHSVERESIDEDPAVLSSEATR